MTRLLAFFRADRDRIVAALAVACAICGVIAAYGHVQQNDTTLTTQDGRGQTRYAAR